MLLSESHAFASHVAKSFLINQTASSRNVINCSDGTKFPVVYGMCLPPINDTLCIL